MIASVLHFNKHDCNIVHTIKCCLGRNISRNLATELRRTLEYNEDQNDAFVKQSMLLDLLNLADTDKSILTRALKSTFPNSKKRVITLDKQKMYPF